jgi:hypothetical protein
MARKSITRVDLTESVYQQAYVTEEHAAELVHQAFGGICSTFKMGKTVKLSSFGVFTMRNKAKWSDAIRRPGLRYRLNLRDPSRSALHPFSRRA